MPVDRSESQDSGAESFETAHNDLSEPQHHPDTNNVGPKAESPLDERCYRMLLQHEFHSSRMFLLIYNNAPKLTV